MKSLIHALNDSYRASANAAEEIASICETNQKAAYLLDMMLNSPSYDSLCEEWYNETVKQYGEPRLQLFYATMDGKQVLDLCEVHYLFSVMDIRDLWDIAIEAIEVIMREGYDG